MTHTGTLLKDLQSIVDACLQSDARVCAICQYRYVDHSRDGARCPVPTSAGQRYSQTRFRMSFHQPFPNRNALEVILEGSMNVALPLEDATHQRVSIGLVEHEVATIGEACGQATGNLEVAARAGQGLYISVSRSLPEGRSGAIWGQ